MSKQATNPAKLFTYNYGRYLPKGILAICAIIVIVSFNYCLHAIEIKSYSFIPSFIVLLASIFAFIPSQIIQIDGELKRYRYAVKIFSFIHGYWKNLNNPRYLSIVSIKKNIHLSGFDGETNIHQITECQLRVYESPGEFLDIDDFEQKSSAIQIAKPLSKVLDLQILDATTKPSYFLEED